MEHRIHPGLFQLEKDLGMPLVATNDSHYLCEEDAHAQDVMVCIQTGKSIHDTARMKFEGTQFFVKSHDEMMRVFKDAPQVVSRTLDIAGRCNLRMEKIATPFPEFDVPPGYTLDSYFVHVTREGYARRLEALRPLREQGKLKHSLADYDQRLERELAIIQQMQFSGYFMIVWDFIRYAKEREIPVGPGRGSAAGSLVSYALGITDLDPLQHELLFERFLNPERVSMPDIDIDFCMNRRGEVINYVTQKYGRDNVAQIITFGTMAAKAAIKDVGRAMDIPYSDVDRIAKMVPTQLNITIEQAIEDSPQLREAIEKDGQIRELIQTARKLEGLVRNSGVHAAGSGDLAAAAHRVGTAAPDQERRNRHRLRHGRHREDGAAENGFSRPDHADDSYRHAEADPADARHADHAGTDSAGRCGDLPESFSQGADFRRLPV